MQVDFISAATSTVIAGGLCGVIGYILGKLGLKNIETDIATLKGLFSGTQKVTVVPAPVVAAPVAAA
jgi:hypothetical protein